MAAIDFYSMYKVMIITLTISCMYPMVKYTRFWVFRLIIQNIVFSLFFGFVTHGLLYFVKERDFTAICGNSVVGTLYASVIIFYLVIFYHREKLLFLVNYVKEDFNAHENLNETEKAIMLDYACQGRNLTIFWGFVAGITGAIHPIRTIVKMLYFALRGQFRYVPVFEYHHPEIAELAANRGLYNFLFWALLTTAYIIHSCSAYTGVIPFCIIFILHACGQIEIIIYRVNKLYPTDRAYNPQDTKDKLKDIIERLTKVYNFIDELNSTFSAMYDFLLKACTAFIPITLFITQKQIKEGIYTLDFVNFIITSIVCNAIICFISTKLQDKGEELRIAIYMCGWETQKDISAGQTILIMLTRAMRPTVLHTMFRAIDLDLFSDVVRQAYILFNLMNTAWN